MLLVDVQHDFWSPERQAAHPSFPDNVARLLAFARGEDIEVLHIRAAFDPDPATWMPRHRLLGKVPYVENTPGAEPLPCARALSGEPVFHKRTFNAFANTELAAHLQAHDRCFVFVAGLATSVCVLATATAAAERGLLVAVVGDACADSPGRHRATLTGYPFVFEVTTSASLSGRQGVWLEQLFRLNG